MIKVNKSANAPTSLSKTSSYDGEDVKQQLLADQYCKCYICERTCVTDFEIEHLKSRKHFPEQIQEWNNLLLSCSYCNKKKGDAFDQILNPLCANIEEEIRQYIDYDNNRAVFESFINDEQHQKTIELLDSIYNSSGKRKIRTIKEEQFFNYVLGVMNRFQVLVLQFLESPTEDNANVIKSELTIDRELLGFKYWLIKDQPQLRETFEPFVVWNR